MMTETNLPNPELWARKVFAECRGEIVESRIVPFSADHGVCIGGRFDGWIMWKHPDGMWLSVRKPEAEAPHSELVARPKAVASETWESRVVQALDEAARLIDYFANHRTYFEGSGTPSSCIAKARSLIAEKAS